MEEAVKVELERIHDEDKRQNKRLDALEEQGKALNELTLSVQRLAIGIEAMTNKQDDMNARLLEIEQRPAQNWNTMTRTIFTTIISAIAGGLAVVIVQMVAAGVH